MRQAGVIAAAALYALDHHIERLAEDHCNARPIAEAIVDNPGLRLNPPEVETNLIWFEVEREFRLGDVPDGKVPEHGPEFRCTLRREPACRRDYHTAVQSALRAEIDAMGRCD